MSKFGNIEAGKELYNFISKKPVSVERYGKCPECGNSNSKIICGGRDGVYCDMVCENGHLWIFCFKESKRFRVG